MIYLRYLILLILFQLVISCSKDEKKVSIIKESSQDLEMVAAYKEGYQSLNRNDPYFAAKKFLEADTFDVQLRKWANCL